MNEPMLSPAEVVIQELGVASIADELRVDRSTVHRWVYPRPRGSGGLVPAWYHASLLRYAQQRGVNLTSGDLVLGRPRPKKGGR